MNFRDEEKLSEKLRSIPNGSVLGIYGVDEKNQEMFHYLKRHDLDISAFVTEEAPKQKLLFGVPVLSLSEYREMAGEKKILLSSHDIKKAKEDTIEYIYIKKNKLIGKIMKLVQFFQDNWHGYQIYRSLIEKYGEDAELLVFPAKSGDLYNASVYLKQYIRNRHAVLLVIGQACVSTAKLFAFPSIEKISLYDAECLIKLYCLLEERVSITPLHRSTRYLSSSIYNNLQQREGMTLGKLFKYYALDFDEQVQPELPDGSKGETDIKEFMEQTGLQEDNTVILSPYANSYMDDALFPFWERLAVELKGRGYKVFTNSAGVTEPAIKGTDALNFDLLSARDVLEKAGYFIALRSGFCDIVSAANCKKIILYCDNIWISVDFFAYHSLETLGLSSDSIELRYDRKQEYWEDRLLDQVLDKMVS